MDSLRMRNVCHFNLKFLEKAGIPFPLKTDKNHFLFFNTIYVKIRKQNRMGILLAKIKTKLENFYFIILFGLETP